MIAPRSLIIPARGAGKPHFTHEKERVYLYTQGGLISLRYDGTDRRTHLQVKAPPLGFSDEPGPADDVRVSPDGNWVLAHIMNQLYVTAMPVVGGEAPTIMINAGSVPVKKIADIGADYFAWADDGKTITWAVGPSFFRQPLFAISFEPPKEEKKEGEKKDEPKTDAKTDGDKKDAAADAQKRDDSKKDEQAIKEPEKFKEQDKSVEEFRVSLEFPRKTPKGTIVLRGATVITMKGDLGHEEVLKNADIVVENNRIKSVGARGSIPEAQKSLTSPAKPSRRASWIPTRTGSRFAAASWTRKTGISSPTSPTASPRASTYKPPRTTCSPTKIS